MRGLTVRAGDANTGDTDTEISWRRGPGPLRKPSGIAAQAVEQHGCRESSDGPGMALRCVPPEQGWSEGTPAQSGPDAGCAFSLGTFSLHRAATRKQRESDSPVRGETLTVEQARQQVKTQCFRRHRSAPLHPPMHPAPGLSAVGPGFRIARPADRDRGRPRHSRGLRTRQQWG